MAITRLSDIDKPRTGAVKNPLTGLPLNAAQQIIYSLTYTKEDWKITSNAGITSPMDGDRQYTFINNNVKIVYLPNNPISWLNKILFKETLLPIEIKEKENIFSLINSYVILINDLEKQEKTNIDLGIVGQSKKKIPVNHIDEVLACIEEAVPTEEEHQSALKKIDNFGKL